MKAPCYLCPNRKLYCHAKCMKYDGFKKELEAKKKEETKIQYYYKYG